MLPEQCPKFKTCSAPICPLDERWPEAAHLRGEAICWYLLASGKAGAAEPYAGDPTFAECLLQLDAVCAAHPDIRKKVTKAARCGFRLSNFKGRRPVAVSVVSTGGNAPETTPEPS